MTETITITQSIEQITVSSTGDTIVVSNAGVAPAPGTFVDNCIIRSNGTSGGSIQCSSVTLSDDGIFAGVKQVNAGLSAGLVLANSNGTAVLTLGAGPGAGSSFAGGLTVAGVQQNTDATDATNLTTASVVLSGGLAVTKQFRVGGAANLSENVTIATGKSLTVDTITATAASVTVSKDISLAATRKITAPGGLIIGHQTLSHYQTGTWTPTLRGSTTAGTHTYAEQSGVYTRIGDLVFVTCRMSISSKDATMAGNILIAGLPFQVESSNDHALSFGQANGIAFTNQLSFYANSGESVINLINNVAGGNAALVVAAAVGATPFLIVSGVYKAA